MSHLNFYNTTKEKHKNTTPKNFSSIASFFKKQVNMEVWKVSVHEV